MFPSPLCTKAVSCVVLTPSLVSTCLSLSFVAHQGPIWLSSAAVLPSHHFLNDLYLLPSILFFLLGTSYLSFNVKVKFTFSVLWSSFARIETTLPLNMMLISLFLILRWINCPVWAPVLLLMLLWSVFFLHLDCNCRKQWSYSPVFSRVSCRPGAPSDRGESSMVNHTVLGRSRGCSS